jgi:hypothetical protein
MAEPARKFRFRFSLRALFVLISAVALLLGWYGVRVRQQRLAIEALEKLGGGITYAHQYKDGRWPGPSANPDFNAPVPGPKWLRAIIGDDLFVTPVALSLDRSAEPTGVSEKINNDEFIHVGKLSALQFVSLTNANIDGECLKHLRGLKNLRGLHLDGTGVSNDDLKIIGTFENLEWLRLSRTGVTGDDLSDLNRLVHLKELILSIAPVNGRSPAGLRQLSSVLPNVKILYDTHWRPAQTPAESGPR